MVAVLPSFWSHREKAAASTKYWDSSGASDISLTMNLNGQQLLLWDVKRHFYGLAMNQWHAEGQRSLKSSGPGWTFRNHLWFFFFSVFYWSQSRRENWLNVLFLIWFLVWSIWWIRRREAVKAPSSRHKNSFTVRENMWERGVAAQTIIMLIHTSVTES